MNGTPSPSLDVHNKVLVAKVSDLKEKRADLQRTIVEDDTQKTKYEEQLMLVKRRIDQLTDSIHRKVDLRNEYQKIIEETEGAYNKLLESSEKLLSVLNRDTMWLEQSGEAPKGGVAYTHESDSLM